MTLSGPRMLLQMVVFHSFLWLNSIPLYPGKLSFKTEYHPAISKKKQMIDTWNSLGKSAVN